MKVAIFLLLTALFGMSNSSMVCLLLQSAACSARLPKSNDDPICGTVKEYNACVRKVARECGVESAPIVGEIVTRHIEVCKKGTQMNELYKKHNTCVFQHAARFNDGCYEPLMKELPGLGSSVLYDEEEVLKASCKYGDSGDKCIQNHIKSNCGEEAFKFRQYISYPTVRLSELACEEIQAETDETPNALRQDDEL